MAIKSIHLPLVTADEELNERPLAYAAELAAGLEAHLAITLGIAKVYVAYPQTDAVSQAVIDGLNDHLRKTGDETAERMRAAAMEKGASVASEVFQAPGSSLIMSFAERSRTSDLVICRAADPGNALVSEVAEEMLLETGRPAIFLPADSAAKGVLNRVMVAWDGGAKAARAVGDAIQLLERAGSVEIVMITEDERDRRSATALQAHLARHVPQVTLKVISPGRGRTGDVIIDCARASGADLLVAGAYGHSRLREFIFGGTTARLFNDPPCPLLMSLRRSIRGTS